jgi:transposase
MGKVVKQVVGIDIAQKELVVCFGRMYEDFAVDMPAYKVFRNTSKGFGELTRWVHKLTSPEISLRYVMEATGVYHEPLAYFLDAAGSAISIVLPNKISNYFKTLEVKTVTDKTMAETITRFALERKLESWKPSKQVFKKLRQLTRERDQLVQERTMVKNQLHAEQAEAEPNTSSLGRIKKRIALLDKQEKQILEELKKLVQQDEQIKHTTEIICSLPGVGLLTAVTILAETNGFELIRNKRQLSSYAGLDVKEKQSGTSIKGKPRISKKGNVYLRKAMHLPALTAIRLDEGFKTIFARLVSRHGIKMKAVVAIQRRLLEMSYILYKNNAVYDKEYFKRANRLQEMIS